MCIQILAPTHQRYEVLDEHAPINLQDSGEVDKERILKFGAATMKKQLSLSNTSFVAGSFRL